MIKRTLAIVLVIAVLAVLAFGAWVTKDIQAHGPLFDSLVHLGDELRYVLITSRASVHRAEGPLVVEVKPSAHPKCDRCWHYRSDVNSEGLCGRCESNLRGPGEPRLHA